jgi:predicted permease
MLAGTVLCVFLIAAANVTSLSLARSVARAQEIGVRRALGASTGRIVQQLVTESVLLACVSGTIGTGLAFAAVSLVRTYGPSNLPRLNEASVDLQVLAWALGVSLMAGVLVGLPSAVATLRRDVHRIGGAGTRGVASSVGARRVRRALVVAEFALAIVLLVGAGLFVRSWWNVTSLDTGFRPARVLMMELAMPAGLQAATAGEAADTLARRSDLYRRVLEQVRAAPGVEDAGFTGDLFIDNDRVQVVTVERDADTMSERLQFVVGEASASFFSTMGTRVIRGRTFSPADGPDRARVVIINEAMARRSWPGGDAVGRRLKLGVREASAPWLTVVGVVANMRRQGPEREPFPQMFVPFTQSPPQSADLMVRLSSDNPMASADAIREAVRRVATDIPVYGVAPLEERLGAYVAQRRFQTVLLAAFSIAALLMAAVGIYGLVQYSVATRTQEIGLRMAIGAGTGQIFRMILGEGLSLSLTGVAIGLAGAWMLGRAAASLLFGVAGSDPLTFGAVSLVLTTVAVLASYFPARRAMRVDPTRALRAT